jgi:hypothetical protein
MTEYEGQFSFLFHDSSLNLIMIDKKQTEALKKKYGRDLNELIIKDPDNWWNRDSIEKEHKAEEKEQQELKKQMQEKNQLEAEKKLVEFKHLMEEKQLETEKAEFELKQLMEQK